MGNNSLVSLNCVACAEESGNTPLPSREKLSLICEAPEQLVRQKTSNERSYGASR